MSEFDFYNVIANTYDELHGEEQKLKYRKFVEVLKNRQYDKKLFLWLDIGSATGMCQEHLRKYFIFRCVCIEPSLKLVEKHLSKRKEDKIINAKIEDIPKKAFSESYFDVVSAFTSLHHVQEEKLYGVVNNIIYWSKDLIVVSFFERAKTFCKFNEILEEIEKEGKVKILEKGRIYKDVFVVMKKV